jgi:Fuc2NAc and GlcNAc transferase
MLEPLLLGVVFAASFAATGAVRIYSLKHQLVEVPGPRHSHTTPTPHGGGVAIAATFLGATVFLVVIGALPLKLFMALFGSGLVVAAIGFWDDHVPVPVQWRILVHFVAAIWALYWLGGFPPLPVGNSTWSLGLAGHLIGVVAAVWLINGIAAVETIMVVVGACLIMVVKRPDDSVLWLGLLGAATLGFLPWNWPPARIFMGDVGSGFLGFNLAVFALYTAHAGALTVWSWTILLGVFIVDATVTLLRRIVTGQRWYVAHRSHAYQHAALRWHSHQRVTLAIFVINIAWLLPLAWFVNGHRELGLIAVNVALIPLLLLALMLGAGRPTHSSRTST